MNPWNILGWMLVASWAVFFGFIMVSFIYSFAASYVQHRDLRRRRSRPDHLH